MTGSAGLDGWWRWWAVGGEGEHAPAALVGRDASLALSLSGGFWLLGTTLLAWRARRAAARGGNAPQSKPVVPPRPATRPTFR